MATEHLRLHLLGAFRLERAGVALALPTRKNQSLLAYLALHPEAHAREKLAALFWGDSTDTSARHSLNVALNALRKTVSPDIVVTTRTTIQLNPDLEIWVDALALETLAGRAAQAPDALAADEQQFLTDGYADLLADFYDDWILSARETLRTLYLDTLLVLAQQQGAQSNYPAAIDLAQRVLGHDPANERAHQQLMFCYIAIGERQKAIEQYERSVNALRQELAVDEPSPETTALYDWIRQTGAPVRGTVRLTNLPIPLTSFIGRTDELPQLQERLARSRLVTLTGAGGSGKTRFAVQAGMQALNRFSNGVWWIDLAPLTEPTGLPETVSRALGLESALSQDATMQLLDVLRSEQRLLIFDNCEHLLDASANLIQTLLQACPGITVLATSREPLNLTGEIVYGVSTLAFPDAQNVPPLAALMDYPAVRLFVERAQAVNAQFTLHADNAAALTQICARLDGIPLALELAAARAHTLSASEIAARLDDRFALLTRGARTALPRQQTLHALIEWSYNLLDEPQRAMFRQLAVFAGGFTLDAVKSVCADEPNPLDVLTHLVEKSLVVLAASGETTRYTMLETIREFAGRELAHAPATQARAAARHLDYFYEMGQQFEAEWQNAFPWHWLDRFFAEVENMQVGLSRALAPKRMPGLTRVEQLDRAMMLVFILWLMWFHRGANVGAMRAFARILELRDVPPGTRLRALELAIFIARTSADWAASHRMSEELRVVALATKDEHMYARSLEQLGLAERNRLRFDAAIDYFEQGRARFGEMASHLERNRLMMYLAETELLRGNLAASRALFEEALVWFRDHDDKGQVAWGVEWLGNLARLEGRFEEAGEAYRSAFPYKLAAKDKHSIRYSLDALAQLAVQQEDPERAVQLYAASVRMRKDLAARSPALVPLYESLLPTARAQLGEQCFTDAWARGLALTLDQAIELAMQI